MKRWTRRFLVSLGVVAAFSSMAFAGSLSLERSFLYHPQPRGAGPDAASGIEVVEIATADGERLVGWWLPPKDGKPVILFFHGNASTLEGDVGRWRRIAGQGAGFLAIAYRLPELIGVTVAPWGRRSCSAIAWARMPCAIFDFGARGSGCAPWSS